jgi:two-component system sensor histidine kinase UhpB
VNLKLRLNLIINVLLLLVMLIGAWLMVRNAREDVRAEVESTAGLALHLLDAEILYYTSDFGWLNSENKNKGSIFRLQSLSNIRHLRIEFYDAGGRLRDSNYSAAKRTGNLPPVWFARAMDIVSSTMPPVRRPVYASGRVLGELVVTPDPTYEIAEIWHDILGLLWLTALFFVAVNAMVYWAVSRALRPVDRILKALNELEIGHLDARLPVFSLPELASISDKFNAMAQTLQSSIRNNHRLAQQMIRLQEDERKNLARDLHDEIGQCLTAIHMDASAILNAKRISDTHESAKAIDSVARHMLDMVHDMLQRLRPGVLEELGLTVALHELIDLWRQRNREISSTVQISDQLNGLDESVAITVYRIVQECLTNIVRHAQAHHVAIAVKRTEDALTLRIQDDGVGFRADAMQTGFGLAGMRERVEGLGGTLKIGSNPGDGVLVDIHLPCLAKEG